MKIKVKMKATTIALFAAVNFALVDFSESTFVYAPQEINIVINHTDECAIVDSERRAVNGTMAVVIDDGFGLPKQVKVNFNTSKDLGGDPQGNSRSFEAHSIDEVSLICEDKAVLINGCQQHEIKYRLSDYQLERIKDIVRENLSGLIERSKH